MEEVQSGLRGSGLVSEVLQYSLMSLVHPFAFMVQKSVFVCAISSAAVHLLYSSSLWQLNRFVGVFWCPKIRVHHYKGPSLYCSVFDELIPLGTLAGCGQFLPCPATD